MLLLTVAFVELVICWVTWSLAFVKAKKQAGNQKKVVRARASLWGIALQGVGFALVWTYARPRGFEKSSISLIISMILGPPSVALAWWATRHLGKQWRYEAALSDVHDLIQTGPVQFDTAPDIRIDVWDVIGNWRLPSMVADVCWGSGSVLARHRGSCTR